MNGVSVEQELRRQLEDYELPSRFLLPQHQQHPAAATMMTTTTTRLDSHRRREYTHARDVYLQRKFQRALVQQVLTTFDGVDKFDRTATSGAADSANEQQDSTENIRPEEWAALRGEQERVKANITATASSYQRALLELQHQHERFQSRRVELLDMLDHPDNNSSISNRSIMEDDANNNDDNNDNDDDSEMDEEALSAQQERLTELQQRRAALQVELQTVQHCHDQKVQAVAQRRAEYQTLMMRRMTHGNENYNSTTENNDTPDPMQDPVALQQLHEQNRDLRAHVEQMTQVQQWYHHMRQFLEELSGVRVLSVEEPVADPKTMVVTAQLRQQFTVEIVLNQDHKQYRHPWKPVSAKIISENTLITGPTLDNDAAEHEHGSSSSHPVVQLQIPLLADLVANANTTCPFQSNVPGEPLRVLVCEIMARIQATQERVQELTLLQTEALTKIGRYTVETNNHSNIIEYQEVVCSLNYAQMTAVLLLTPDCPLVPGSVILDQLVGLGGWETALVEQIKNKVGGASAAYQSPVALVRAIKAEIQRLQDDERMVLPATPRMPVVRDPGRV